MSDEETTTPSPIDRLLEQERLLLRRLEPRQAEQAVRAGGVIVDTRSHEQRAAGGIVPGSIRVHRNVLEWRVDPTSAWFDERFAAYSGPVIVMCEQGYSSSLAAATLQRLGCDRATDMVGGFQAWSAAGLPVRPLSAEPDAGPIE
ncbi:MAG: rhodanese-like domain-containing protein [Gaiellales bacterium]